MKLTGDKELIKKLSSLEKRDAKAAIRKGTRAGSKEITQEAKAMAPVETGKLKQAIKTRAAKRLKRGSVGTVTTVQMQGKTKGNMYYGAFQEYGWTAVNGRKIQGKHFLKNAAEKAGPQALNTAVTIMKSEIEKRAS